MREKRGLTGGGFSKRVFRQPQRARAHEGVVVYASLTGIVGVSATSAVVDDRVSTFAAGAGGTQPTRSELCDVIPIVKSL